jgi:hypothetical protein
MRQLIAIDVRWTKRGMPIHVQDVQMDDNAEQFWLLGKMLLFVAGVVVALALLGI